MKGIKQTSPPRTGVGMGFVTVGENENQSSQSLLGIPSR
jgi:hypothetical protein